MDIFDVSTTEVEKVGRASILPQQLQKDEGKLILTVFSTQLLPVGTITSKLQPNISHATSI